ncbi:lysine-specific demethylase 4C-like [Anneissia japonica]|uniref:lysine-specific demethylase 4C-like n=1 Tax=Anneissia japonica TaxID=1529436 RepID=UPI0014258610|nr:lysine-specific demethylase 4C-like [Anneissia japonica]
MASQCPEIMVFHPTLEEMEDFSKYVKYMESQGAHKAGIAKIIPPPEFVARSNYDDLDLTIPAPIQQEVTGQQGLYTQYNIQKKPIHLRDYKRMAESSKYTTPIHEDYEDLERKYWKNVSFNPPIYGADISGSIYDKDRGIWNINNLNTVLDIIEDAQGVKIEGVNTAYLYFGMWKTTFAWHTEDMDLYSINYLHFGAPKSWYAIPPQHGKRLERLAAGFYPSSFKICPNFLRHKMTLISPSLLRQYSIPVNKITQERGQFMITFPFGYHAGFNHGFNCAESTNFASERWIDYGKRASHTCCNCQRDSVKISMDPFVLKFQPDRYELWLAGKDNIHIEELDGPRSQAQLQTQDGSKSKLTKNKKQSSGQKSKGSRRLPLVNKKDSPGPKTAASPRRAKKKKDKKVSPGDEQFEGGRIEESVKPEKNIADSDSEKVKVKTNRGRPKKVKVKVGEGVQGIENGSKSMSQTESIGSDNGIKLEPSGSEMNYNVDSNILSTQTKHLRQSPSVQLVDVGVSLQHHNVHNLSEIMTTVGQTESVTAGTEGSVTPMTQTDISTNSGHLPDGQNNFQNCMANNNMEIAKPCSTSHKNHFSSQKLNTASVKNKDVASNSSLAQPSVSQAACSFSGIHALGEIAHQLITGALTMPNETPLQTSALAHVVSNQCHAGRESDDILSDSMSDMSSTSKGEPVAKRKRDADVHRDEEPLFMQEWAKSLNGLWVTQPFHFEMEQAANNTTSDLPPGCCVCQLFYNERGLAFTSNSLLNGLNKKDTPKLQNLPNFHKIFQLEEIQQDSTSHRRTTVLAPEICFAASARNPEPTDDTPFIGDDGKSALLQCSLCKVQVHSSCYGVPTPTDNKTWQCQRCSAESWNAECCLCNLRGGALKTTTKEGMWAHIVCAMAIPDVTFVNVQTRQPINVNGISSARFKLKCHYCRSFIKYSPKYGACIQCSVGKCVVSFHVTCAYAAGVIMEPSEWPYPVYSTCLRHVGHRDVARQQPLTHVHVGERVIAKYRNARYYYADVVDTRDQIFYHVNFEDGSYSDNLFPEDIQSHHCLRDGPPAEGEPVRVLWTDNQVYNGCYVACNKVQMVDIEFEDGVVMAIKREDVYANDEPLPKKVKSRLSSASDCQYKDFYGSSTITGKHRHVYSRYASPDENLQQSPHTMVVPPDIVQSVEGQHSGVSHLQM